MAQWQEVIQEGQVFYVNNDLGNIMKVGDVYISMLPIVCKLGPFKTLDEAKAAFHKKMELKDAIEQFNESLMSAIQ